jgi:phosphoribosylglycinamide formyltransferase 1
MEKIAIFASGTGSNAQKIIEHFRGHPKITVSLVVSNKAEAPVLYKAAAASVDTLVIRRRSFYETTRLLEDLRAKGISFIVLAGFLWLVPAYLIKAYPQRIINIHPALLPKFGGKGMYGKYVHQAVKAAGEQESGITIHWVTAEYDEGGIVFQARCPLAPSDEPEDIARKVQQLEHKHFAPVVEKLLTERKPNKPA